MKKYRVVAYIHWGLCVSSLFAAVSMSDTEPVKTVVFYLVLAVIWFFSGFIYWKRSK